MPLTYPTLSAFATNPLSPRQNNGLRAFKDHANLLAKDNAITQLRSLQQEIQDLYQDEVKARKNHMMRILRRLSPGRPTHLQAVQTGDGSVTTDPALMANALRKHWSKVFCARRLHESLLSTWMNEDLIDTQNPLPPTDHPCWEVTQEDILKSITRSPNTSPGPDGIPFIAWRQLGEMASPILHKA